MKTYRGSAAAARSYVQAGRARADDYYLAEGTGIAQRYAACADGAVRELAALDGDSYQAWVAGVDPGTGVAKGRLRHDPNAVRFVEIVVNGPKSWSLAAELHPDISAAYDTAQDTAAREIIAWLAAHSTTRVGPRGAQVQVPVEQVEAAVVRHYSSRAGDPHRHLHLQINARVLASGRWRGLHTVGVRDSLDAINGIGHAAVMSDPGFRGALAAHGFTLDPSTGEVRELASFVGPFSARAAQIGRNLDRYQTQWRAANPGREPGPALRRAWDSRAWAEARPDKITPRDGTELTARWVGELRDLGYHDPTGPVPLETAGIGALDRQQAVADVVSRLGARRSGWNAADIRGEVEQHLARAGIVTTGAVRGELAEDLTARAVAACVRLLDRRDGVPEHVRNLTSTHVLAVEADLIARLTARAATGPPSRAHPDIDVDIDIGIEVSMELDRGQRQAIAVLAGDADLVVVEGAAGAGKTATLTATHAALEQAGHRLIVLTPTRKAAQVAAAETGAAAFSAAWLAHQHGYRWSDHGTWTRLAVGETDPVTGSVFTGPSERAALRSGDLVLVDEAGMLDQDTARALLTIADQHHVRLALVGDRHQLPAIGRGGVLDLAARWAHPDTYLTLQGVHRFSYLITSQDGAVRTVPDVEYADLSLAMRAGQDPGTVFDALVDRGQIRVHASDPERLQILASQAAEATAGTSDQDADTVLIADTREQVVALNAAIHDQLVAAGTVDDSHALTISGGQAIGTGDRVATRRNDTHLDVANRDTWTITAVHQDDTITVTGERGTRTLPAEYVREHIELAYACTVYGAQGATTNTAQVLLGEHSTATSAYVAMTRGRHDNTAHLVAEDVHQAREQWIAVFTRDRADLGPTGARRAAEHALARYGTQPTAISGPADAQQLAAALDRLRAAWTTQAAAHTELERAQDKLAAGQAQARWWEHCQKILDPLRAREAAAADTAQQAGRTAQASTSSLAAATQRHEEALRRAWSEDLADAHDAARTVAAGTGRLGLHRTRVRDAQTAVDVWTDRWQAVLEETRIDPAQLQRLPTVWFSVNIDRVRAALHRQGEQRAAAEHPDHAALLAAADHAEHEAATARRDYYLTHEELSAQHRIPHHDPTPVVDELNEHVHAATERAARRDEEVTVRSADPAISSQPDPDSLLADARAQWRHERDTEEASRVSERARAPHVAPRRATPARAVPYHSPDMSRGPSIGI